MNSIFAITLTLFRESVREKLWYILLFSAIASTGLILILKEMTIGPGNKAFADLSLLLISTFPLIILIFSGIQILSKNINSRSVYFIFSKPVTRFQFISAAYLFLCLTCFTSIISISSVLILLSIIFQQGALLKIIICAFLATIEFVTISGFALLFTVQLHTQSAMFLTFTIYVCGHTIKQTYNIIVKSANSLNILFIKAVRIIIPDLEFFNQKHLLLNDLTIQTDYYFKAILYSLVYILLLLFLSYLFFKKREL